MERGQFKPLIKKNHLLFLGGILIMLAMAFYQGYKMTHDLHWVFSIDFDRDMAFIQGNLDGHFGKDPSYLGEYLWYSPLLFSIESVIVNFFGLAPNIVVTQAGIYLNLLAPVAFVMMMLVLFDFETALAALLSFLFLASGNILCWGAATYSPWLYPVCFVQFLFYLNIIFLYKALSTQRYVWFILLGSFTGLAFLGHVAPAVILILMIALVQGNNIFKAIRVNDLPGIRKYLYQSMMMAITFLVVASPILVVIYGKYKMHYLNREPFEFNIGIFTLKSMGAMIKANVSFTFLISLGGAFLFYKKMGNKIVRLIITCWLVVCVFMYGYTSIVPFLDHRLHIYLPVTVPSFHYFFYLKALESVFFGIGLVGLLDNIVRWLSKRLGSSGAGDISETSRNLIWVVLILSIAFIYYPVYRSRMDFTFVREKSVQKEADKDKLAVYYFITQHIPSGNVILCELDQSMFPVMATGRKMVSTIFTMSNPFVDFEQRENDRSKMLSFLASGMPATDKQLFTKYQVSYILLSNLLAEKIQQGQGLPGQIIFQNKSYVLLAVDFQNR